MSIATMLHNPDFYWGIIFGVWIGGFVAMGCFQLAMR